MRAEYGRNSYRNRYYGVAGYAEKVAVHLAKITGKPIVNMVENLLGRGVYSDINGIILSTYIPFSAGLFKLLSFFTGKPVKVLLLL